jgi:predicted site-specific integrase-resolvase
MKYKLSADAKLNNVTYRTVWNWVKDGKLTIEKTNTGRFFIVENEVKQLSIGIYARVSSSENKANLETQKQLD